MRLKKLTLSFGTQPIFDHIDLYIPEREHIGLVGVNGAGKSTFFKLLTKELTPDDGEIILESKKKIALLPQVITDEIPSLDMTVFEFLESGRPIEQLEKKLQSTYEELAEHPEKEKILYQKINRIQSDLEYYEQYKADTILLKIIEGMHIDGDMLDQPLKNLSGGQKSTVAFARLLYSKPEIILLDEPTNHLDLMTKDYVVQFLKSYSGTIFIISHDTEFLNQVATTILFLDKRTHKMELYPGNYDRFLKLHAEHEKNLLFQAKIEEREENKLRAIVQKYEHGNGKRKKMAQDREKKLAKLLENKIEVPPSMRQVTFQMDVKRESGMTPVRVEKLCFKYDKTKPKGIINKLSFSLHKGEKFLIVGENGVGKSTLLKLIVGILKPDFGTIEIGNHTDIGYYAQEHELLDKTTTIFDNFHDTDLNDKEIRSALGRFLFSGDEVFKNVSILSPGEQSRVALAKLSVSGANFLILDEPTNHLDPDTQKIISKAFQSFEGTMLVVSHNPEFVYDLGIGRILLLPEGKIVPYDEEIVKHYHTLNTKHFKNRQNPL